MLKHNFMSAEPPARVVLLGGSGFVGQAVLRRLSDRGVPHMSLASRDLDLTAKDAAAGLAARLQPSDALVFISARAPVRDEAMLIDNLLMGRAVCDALRDVSVAHVLYVSSDAVYADSDTPLSETSCAQPGSLHGVMHLAREVMLENAFAGPLAFLRPTLIYGADDPHNGYGPNRFLRLIEDGTDITLFGKGEERRDHVWVEDVAELAVRILMHRSEGRLNAATGSVHSFREIAEMLVDLTGSSIEVRGSPRQGPMPHRGYRPFDAAATHRAFPDFAYTPLARGLAHVYAAKGKI